MTDLEHLLLEAAGRTRTSRRKGPTHSQMRRLSETYTDDGSDSEDGEIPPPKRYDHPNKDGRQGHGNDHSNDHDSRHGSFDSDSELSIGSDLYKDEDDRERLAKMSELERELILAERSTRRDDYRLKKKARASLKMKRIEETPPPPPRFGRPFVRSDRKSSAKDEALNELRAKRLRVLHLEHTPFTNNAEEFSPPKLERLPLAPAVSDSSSSDDGFAGDYDVTDSDEDGSALGMDLLTFDDVEAITIQRSKLAKWFMEPFFEELIAGCFVRVGIGMLKSGRGIYRLCMVKNVDSTEPNRTYKLENKTTHKYLNCIWGSDASAARWQMAKVSNAPPTEEEFKALEREVARGGGSMPSRSNVLEKIETLKRIHTFVYSAAAVKQMLQEKKSASSRPLNVAAEKNRLRKELEVAEARGDEAEIQRIQAKMKDLNMSRCAVKDSKASRLAEMNRRNRAENFKNASGFKPMISPNLKCDDPFSRRQTISCNYFSTPKLSGDGEGNAAKLDAGKVASSIVAEPVVGAEKLAAADRGTELHMLHDFDIPISLDKLQKFGGADGLFAGFMARKQKIEAMMGCKMQEEEDGKRHELAMSISDYRKRMGLL